MSRVFAYARVSTTGQTTENQFREIAAAGFAVEPRRVISETVSGGEAIDVSRLAQMGVRVHCLALGGVDLASSAGRMTMGVINAVAQFERDLLIERTQSGLARARTESRRIGRPPSLDPARRAEILAGLERGESLSALAKRHGTSRQTILRLRDAARRTQPFSSRHAPM